MQGVRVVLAALVLGAPLTAGAAEVTRLASSFEENDPFGLFVDLGFERTQRNASITHETQAGGAPADRAELNFRGVDSRLNIDVKVGLYRDLQLSFRLPVIIQQNQRWDYAAGNTAATSTITNNCLNADGTSAAPGCQPLYGVPAESFRGGLGNMTFGLAYAFFNQDRDETKPTWVVAFDYEAPTAALLNPTEDTSDADSRGGVGDRTHKYTFSTALSRRIGVAEPYFRASYTLPYRGPGWYSNCDDPDPSRMAHPENCNTAAWTREDTGIRMPHEAGVLFGSEFAVWDNPAKQQKVRLDARLIGNYVSSGRYANELSQLAHKLLDTQDYLQLGGRVGFYASATDFFQLRLGTGLVYNTAHDLTRAELGKDVNGDGKVDSSAGSDELNPDFDFRADLPGRRFRINAEYDFSVDLTLAFNF
ncbi:hypothetical protein FGE12_16190 [Aggregicoccus sp. 17bor-14]|uniref:hypothetical protein n=1 Tax=Myxococcaceae TaxID=31 RepID=UPI00129C5399|nr:MULTISPECIES: hypothetical protein [Myxococcaceae]MBF5043940.1 hypothetical protein [Simulacricoccus sp. 17bor-14]MRI89691.1 hypothetical protein [Aggregicoccus sp. 17bor-14]